MSAPTIPPRPARAAQGGPTAVAQQDVPKIPPRPARKTDRSISPSREAYTRSPLNEPPTAMSNGRMYSQNQNLSASELPRRPPSVSLPSIGQEGDEYASFDQLPPEALVKTTSNTLPLSAEQTRNVAADLPMHAPKASVPQSQAKQRIQTVTRTDSSQAAAAGIGKARPEDDTHTMGTSLSRQTSNTNDLRRIPSADPHPLRASASFNRSSSSIPSGSTPRPGSLHGDDHEEGIPHIGIHVPMYPNAGDVQAPSPSPYQAQHTPGIGFWNDGSTRAHNRKRSSRQEFGPPGSYGMHGHGQVSTDQFEQAWRQRHPNEAARDESGLLVPRPETALSSDDLNKLVRDNNDVGMGTSREAIGTPSEQIGYMASEEYAQRMSSPRPIPISGTRKRPSSAGQTHVESPLRKSSFPHNETAHLRDNAVESETEDDSNVIHVNPPARRGGKIGGGGYDPPTEDLGPHGGNTAEEGGWIEERGYGTPILASDEIAKRPGSAFMQPAVSPEQERRGSDYYAGYDSEHPPAYQSGRRNSRPTSRPSSRPNSMHGGFGGPLSRFMSHEEHDVSGMGTPLEEIEEYEPLFPEDDMDPKSKPKTAADKLKRPDTLARHHFPSQDVWEDTPTSLQLQTTVDTPQMPDERLDSGSAKSTKPAAVFETPEQEAARRAGNDVHNMTSDTKTFAKPHFKAGVADEIQQNGRPGLGQRFPSQDIWEDSPDSMYLQTTVSGPQTEEIKSPPDDRPTTTLIPAGEARATTGMSQLMKPSIPARPERKSKLAEEIKAEVPERLKHDERADQVPDLGAKKDSSPTKTQAPAIPERLKPSVPARPARTSHSDQTDGAGAPLAKSISATSAGSVGSSDTVTSPPVPKAKPVVPARPGGSKIAALQAGFMNDLNSRLKLGPKAPPKVQEPEPELATEEEKAPLADARKGRAKGPARRKPASSPSGAPSAFSFASPTTLWHIDEKDELNVPASSAAADAAEAPAAEKAIQQNIESNLLDVAPAEAPKEVSAGLDAPVDGAKDQPPAAEATEAAPAMATPHLPEHIGFEGDEPYVEINESNIAQHKAVQPGMEQALASAEPAAESAEDLQAKDAVLPEVHTTAFANGEESVMQAREDNTDA